MLYPISRGGRWGFIDAAGNVVIAPAYECVRDCSDGLIGVRSDGHWGFVDTTGEIVIGCQYERATEFQEGLAAVRVGGRYGFVDRRGEWAIKPAFDFAGWFSEGLVDVSNGDAGYFVDAAGRKPFAACGEQIFEFSGGRAYVESGGKVGFIRADGTWAVPPEFDFALAAFTEGVVAVSQANSDWFFVDNAGARAFAGDFQRVRPFSEGMAPVIMGGKWGYIDHGGNFVIDLHAVPGQSNSREDTLHTLRRFGRGFHCGLAAAWDWARGAYGYIDRRGQWAIAPGLDIAGDFNGGLAYVERGDARHWIDVLGRVVWQG